jgi:hypothetical protein
VGTHFLRRWCAVGYEVEKGAVTVVLHGFCAWCIDTERASHFHSVLAVMLLREKGVCLHDQLVMLVCRRVKS